MEIKQTLKELMGFETMYSTTVLRVLWYLAVTVTIFFGIVGIGNGILNNDGKFVLVSASLLVGGLLLERLIFERLIVIFRIYEALYEEEQK